MKKLLVGVSTLTLLLTAGCSNEATATKETKEERKKLIQTTEKEESEKEIVSQNNDKKVVADAAVETSGEKEISAETISSDENVKEEGVRPDSTEPISSVTVESKTLASEKNGMVLDIQVPYIQGIKNAEKQNEINNRFLQLGKTLEEETRRTEEGLKEIEGMNLHAEGVLKFAVKSNGRVLSIVINQYVFSGGAHGTMIKIPFNYDIEKNEELALADLFVNENYIQEVSEKAKGSIQKSEIKEYFMEEFKQIKPSEKFYLTKDHLVLVFDMYEYTSGVAGSPEIFIEKSSLASLKEEYK